jgi:glycosyltransferase involved in cell wall biosynthesis
MNKNIKLLILINDLSFFYSHRLPIAIASRLEGFDVLIGYGELGGADPKILESKGIKLNQVPMLRGRFNVFKDLKTFINIFRLFKKEKPDIVHLVTIKPYLYGGIISRLVGIKSIVSAVTGLGSLFHHNDLKSKIIRFILTPFFKIAFNHKNQKVILQNNDDANYLIKWGVLSSNKIEIIKGSGINLNSFKEFKEKNGLPKVCLASRLLKDKGIYDFISAAKIIKERKINAQFLIAGDLDLMNPSGLSVDDLKKIKEENYVGVIGYEKNIAKLYSESHIVCLPSYREGLPKSLIEAAAASRAIVTTDVPGCRDAIIANKTGLLVPVKNPKKLADAIQYLLEHPQERIAMGKAGRILAENQFSIEKIVKNHLDIYKKLYQKK